LGIAAVLIIVLVIGTIYGFAKRGKTSQLAAPPPAVTGTNENIFSGLGLMRIPTAEPESETLIISIAFPYNKNDSPFFEELASRVGWFKSITTDYFGALTAGEIAGLNIESVKSELLRRYNAELRLGQIRELYIEEFMVL
jgi:flagellar basal body-associated protein FliL